MAKSDALDDADVFKVTRLVTDIAKMEEASLKGARVRLEQAFANLFSIYVARLGASRHPGSSKPKQQDAGEDNNKLLKRKLHAPKEGWKDPKGVAMHVFPYRFYVYQHVANIF
jgi:hypothetical protein